VYKLKYIYFIHTFNYVIIVLIFLTTEKVHINVSDIMRVKPVSRFLCY